MEGARRGVSRHSIQRQPRREQHQEHRSCYQWGSAREFSRRWLPRRATFTICVLTVCVCARRHMRETAAAWVCESERAPGEAYLTASDTQ